MKGSKPGLWHPTRPSAAPRERELRNASHPLGLHPQLNSTTPAPRHLMH
ncbi:hypothetical protein CGMCC3_g319 [Colletotrichum fructicola]|nr:uncharacterized protein CGMCC3_g319 [Colletotrichum fructicola]KAE9583977.1 hypothetical protein CGMCC3_g319 [Colletotrichum fructicola]